MQVQLVNFAGLDEVGIDGGGIFREFLAELLKTSYDPNRGLFKYTRDRTLYPNPGSRLLMADFTSHYYFLGRILGKVSIKLNLPETRNWSLCYALGDWELQLSELVSLNEDRNIM